MVHYYDSLWGMKVIFLSRNIHKQLMIFMGFAFDFVFQGSTCVFCEAILRNCGFRTGMFTSPHLIDVRERFRIDG